MLKQLVCLFLLLCGQTFSALKVDVSAKAAILVNAETGAVIWEKNAHTPLFPASTTKMVTALYAMEKKMGCLEELITASSDAVLHVTASERRSSGMHPPYRLEFGGTHMGIVPGEVLPLKTLIYGLMLSSGNDAANVIAEYVSGSTERFMEELNAFIRSKGCQDTFFCTPHGLPHEEHKTTAHDMAILARSFLQNPFLREVVKTVSYPRAQTNKQAASILNQHNGLVIPGKFFYPKAIGIKTGYTLASGFTLVCGAEDPNRKLVAVLMGCEKVEQRYKDAIALFEAGFNEAKVSRTLFSKGFDLFSCAIEGGKNALNAYLPEDLTLSYYPSEEPEFTTHVQWDPLELPVKTDQKVGTIEISLTDGSCLASASLYALKAVEPTLSYKIARMWCGVKRGLIEHMTLLMAISGALILLGTFIYVNPSKKQKAK